MLWIAVCGFETWTIKEPAKIKKAFVKISDGGNDRSL